MVKARLHGSQAGLDIAQTLAIGQLRKSQSQELIQAGKTLHLVLALVAVHTAVELLQGKKCHDLGKDGAVSIHAPKLPRGPLRVQIVPACRLR